MKIYKSDFEHFIKRALALQNEVLIRSFLDNDSVLALIEDAFFGLNDNPYHEHDSDLLREQIAFLVVAVSDDGAEDLSVGDPLERNAGAVDDAFGDVEVEDGVVLSLHLVLLFLVRHGAQACVIKNLYKYPDFWSWGT